MDTFCITTAKTEKLTVNGKESDYLYIETNESALRCEIWIDSKHSRTYKCTTAYQEAIQHGKALGYAICVYVGGEMPLLPVIDDLLHAPKPVAA